MKLLFIVRCGLLVLSLLMFVTIGMLWERSVHYLDVWLVRIDGVVPVLIVSRDSEFLICDGRDLLGYCCRSDRSIIGHDSAPRSDSAVTLFPAQFGVSALGVHLGEWEGRSGLFAPFWFLCLLCLVDPAVELTAWHRSRGIRRSDRCRKCEYDLTGNISGRCPECGLIRAGGTSESSEAAT